MKYKKGILSLFIALALIVIVIASRYYLVSWVVTQYFSSKDIKIEFSVSHFSLSGIELSDVVIEDQLKLEEVGVWFKSQNFEWGQLTDLSVKIKQLDWEAMQRVQSKMIGTENPGKSSQLDFVALKELCQQIEPLALDIQVDEIFLKDKVTTLGLKIKKDKNSTLTHLLGKGVLESSPLLEQVSFSKVDYQANTILDCLSDEIKWSLDSLSLVIEKAQVKTKPLRLSALKTSVVKGEVLLKPDSSVEIRLPGSLNLDMTHEQKRVALLSESIDLQIKTNMTSFSINSLSLQTQSFAVHEPLKFSGDNFEFQLKSQGAEPLLLKGAYKGRGLKFKTDEDKELLTGLNTGGEFNCGQVFCETNFNLTDKTKNLSLKGGKLKYNLSSGKSQITFYKKRNSVQLNDQLSEFLPLLKDWDVKGSGKLFINGSMKANGLDMGGRLLFSSDGLDIDSKYGSIKKLKFHHDLLGFPSLASSQNQKLSAQEIIYGPSLQDLSFNYRVAHAKNVEVNSFALTIDGVKVQGENFRANPKLKTLEGFKAQVSMLPLEKVLKMALGDTVTASGQLSGHLRIDFENKKPLFKGAFKADSKGWIRYRKPGAAPFDPNAITANPMSILEGYLYDFYYDSLDIEFVSDANYDLKMTLRALGKNPQYLSGKPLKLNINLDQNLLAAFKAMVLTYDMPGRLKEKIEKLGNK